MLYSVFLFSVFWDLPALIGLFQFYLLKCLKHTTLHASHFFFFTKQQINI